MSQAAGGAARLVDGALIVLTILALALVTLQVAVPALGGRIVVITGGSMEPGIPIGSLVVDTAVDPATLKVGDIVTIRTGTGALVTHRITRLALLSGVPYIETKGDANGAPDPVITPATDVIGHAVVSVPVAGRVALAMTRPLAWVAFASVSGTLWMLGGLLRRPGQRVPAASVAYRGGRLSADRP